jgi:hypothetical protein
MGIVLSQTIGSVAVEVSSAGLPGPSEGIALRFQLDDGPIAFTFTEEEARWLLAQIQRQLARA